MSEVQVIETALPLPAHLMVEFFKNKAGIKFKVDYQKSIEVLKSQQAVLNYVANLQLNVEFDFDTIPVDLLYAYSMMRDTVRCEQLTTAHANVLYFAKYSDILYDSEFELFGWAEIAEYIQLYPEEVVQQMNLLESIPLYVQTAMGSGPDDDRSSHELVTTIDEEQYQSISVNLCQLFGFNDFLLCYLEVESDIEDQIYFKRHFDDNMYSGQTMFALFATQSNTYFGLFRHVADLITENKERELVDLYGTLIGLSGDSEAMNQFAEDNQCSFIES